MKNNPHLIDKILAFGLVIAGLLTLIYGHLSQSVEYIPVVVILGGVLTLVSAQSMQVVLQLLEKQFNLPLQNTSANTSPTTSPEVSPTTSLTTSSQTASNDAPTVYTLPHVSGTASN